MHTCAGVAAGWRAAALLLALVVACSGGKNDGQPASTATFTGKVTYDFVPATYVPATGSGTLDFANAQVRPVRGAEVQVRQGATLLGSTTTDAQGDYAVTFDAAGPVTLVALARTPSPPIQVEDNTDGNAIWAVGLDADPVTAVHDLHATHGWTGTAYDPAHRIAAPFAILDSMVTAEEEVLAVRSPVFPLLKVNWSPNNTNTCCNKAAGQIVTSHYSPTEGEIYILGKAGIDTDEFDSHVIVHEWGHYFEDKLSRADSPGGPHGPGDVLDPRLAFGEGYGNAIAAMLLPEPVYADTLWSPPNGSTIVSFGFDAETEPSPTDDFAYAPYQSLNPGPFSEMSVLRFLYDVWDGGANEAYDAVSTGIGPIYDVLVGPQKTTPALTTLGSFVAGLKAQPGVNAGAVDALLAHYHIGPITTEWGDGDANLRAMYRDVGTLPFPDGIVLDGGYDANKWQAVEYWRLAGTGSQVTVKASSTSDVALEAFWGGALVAAADLYFGGPTPVTETMSFATTAGQTYVIVLTGFEANPVSYDVNLSVTSP